MNHFSSKAVWASVQWSHSEMRKQQLTNLTFSYFACRVGISSDAIWKNHAWIQVHETKISQWKEESKWSEWARCQGEGLHTVLVVHICCIHNLTFIWKKHNTKRDTFIKYQCHTHTASRGRSQHTALVPQPVVNLCYITLESFALKPKGGEVNSKSVECKSTRRLDHRRMAL